MSESIILSGHMAAERIASISLVTQRFSAVPLRESTECGARRSKRHRSMFQNLRRRKLYVDVGDCQPTERNVAASAAMDLDYRELRLLE